MLRNAWLAWLLKSGPAIDPSATCAGLAGEEQTIFEPVAIVEIAEPGIGASPSMVSLLSMVMQSSRSWCRWDLVTWSTGGSGSRGRPSVRSPIRLRWISLVPAQIDDAW